MQRKRHTSIGLLLFVFLALVNIAGCSNLSGPSDAEIIGGVKEFIQRSADEYRTIKLTSSVEIVERGSAIQQANEIIYPVQVRFSHDVIWRYSLPVSSRSKVLIANFKKVQDQMGKHMWLCQINSNELSFPNSR